MYRSGDADSVTTLFFAGALAGPPVTMITRVGDTVVMEFRQVERQTP